eukprot:symbB.v1.2.019076.t1/scaffold1542.1/size112718/11
MHRWVRWLSIFPAALSAAGDDIRAARVMRAQKHDLQVLQMSGHGVSDAEDDTAESTDRLESLNSSFSGLQCSEMPSGFCCGLSPKKIRIDAGDENCACAGPEGGGKFGTQEAIDKYCKEVIQPCKQLSHVVCCEMSPKMIRHHDGNDQCWCSGPQANTSYSTQSAIDDWCAAVIKPCSAVSEGHCCHMRPKQVRQGAGDKCWCSGPSLGTRFPSQAHIDQACSKVVKSCSEISRTECCSLSPKQIRYNDGQDGCWCSGPVVGEVYSTQKLLDEWCEKATAITTTTTTATTHTTTTIGTTTIAAKDCNEVSEAMCCAMTPKRTMMKLPGNKCICAAVNSTIKFQTQEAIDASCGEIVRPCASFRQEDCCTASPRRYLVGDDAGVQAAVGTDKMCTCAGPLKGSRYTQQEAINEACSRFFTPCSELQQVSCCLSSPAKFRDGSGDQCFCYGPSPRGSVKTQQDIDKKCSQEIKSCTMHPVATCCSKSPKEVRVSDGVGRCWCSGPFVNGNMSYSQDMINSMCVKPQTLQMA